jgi:cysteine desulfurase
VSGRIYFDHSATTPLDPRVLQAMLPFLENYFGNASSQHDEGRIAREAVEKARAQVADLLNADANEIVFTGSGTEADNLALIGAVRTSVGPAHVITSSIEHAAVLEACKYLEGTGASVTHLPVDSDGLVDALDLEAALRPETRIVSVMAASNLVGTIQPIAELAEITAEDGALFHTDAVQAGGKSPVDVKQAPIDLVSLSAHKLHGPKGIGALFVRRGVELSPIVFGGGQERGLRSATENVAAIVGFGVAAEIAREEMEVEADRLRQLREKIVRCLAQSVPQAYVIGHPEKRLPGHLSLGFAGQEILAGRLVHHLDKAGVAVSAGSACNAHHADKPSGVLLAMGFDAERARGLLRITLGRFNTEAEVDRFLQILPGLVAELNPDLDWTTSPQLAGPVLAGTSV